MNRAVASVPVHRVGAVNPADDQDQVAVEEPLEIRLIEADASPDSPGESIAITMRTPGHDAELATGFAITEGIVANAGELAGVEWRATNVIGLRLASGYSVDLDSLRRHFYATSSCGVCGKASLDALRVRPRYSLSDEPGVVDPSLLPNLVAQLAQRQAIFSATGGLHAAAGFSLIDGRLLSVHEDIGRHNAVDKLIGAAAREARLPLSGSGILVSGRAGFEIVQKALMAGCPVMAAVGAPSSLAVELAWEFGMTLIGFLRDGRFNVYAGPNRLRPE